VSVHLLVPDRIQSRRTPACDYLAVTDGTGRALELVADPTDFGHRVTIPPTGPDHNSLGTLRWTSPTTALPTVTS
jgi:hypothetical protein